MTETPQEIYKIPAYGRPLHLLKYSDNIANKKKNLEKPEKKLDKLVKQQKTKKEKK